MAYATEEELEEYVAGWPADVPVDVDKLLERASRDVDRLLIVDASERDTESGYQVDPAELEDWQAAALSRATCAQAEFRERMGEDWFVEAPVSQHIGPKTRAELRNSGFRLRLGPRSVLVARPVYPEDA